VVQPQDGIRHRSNMPGTGRTGEGPHNSRDGRKKDKNSFCCVTTRSPEYPQPSPRTDAEGLSKPLELPDGALAAPAPQPHALAESPIGFAALVDA